MPGAPSSFLLLVVMPGATSSVLAPSTMSFVTQMRFSSDGEFPRQVRSPLHLDQQLRGRRKPSLLLGVLGLQSNFAAWHGA